MKPLKAALSFVEAINSQQINKISELMTFDHVFIDSDGTRISGRERMQAGWEKYFLLVPDYRINVEETFVKDKTVILLGIATGTFSYKGVLDQKNRWSVPAAWRVVIVDGRVSVWQLYVNIEPMLKIMKRLGIYKDG